MFVFSSLKSSYFTPAILLLSDAEKSLLSACHSLLKFFFLLRLICLGFFYNFTSPGLCKYFFLSLLIVLHTTSKPSCFRITLNSSGFIRICFVTFIPLLSFPKLIFYGNNPCSLLLNNLHFLIYFVVVVDKGNVYLWLAIIYINSLHDRANFFNLFHTNITLFKTEYPLFQRWCWRCVCVFGFFLLLFSYSFLWIQTVIQIKFA